MSRVVKYTTAHQVRAGEPAGDLRKYEEEALIILQYSRKTFVDEEVLADSIVFIRNNWESWDTYKGLWLKYKIYRTYSKSFKAFNKMMSKKVPKLREVYYGEEYYFVKSLADNYYIQNSTRNEKSITTIYNYIEKYFAVGKLTNCDYVDLNRLMNKAMSE